LIYNATDRENQSGGGFFPEGFHRPTWRTPANGVKNRKKKGKKFKVETVSIAKDGVPGISDGRKLNLRVI